MRIKLTPEQRFWSKVDPCRTDGCMLYLSPVTSAGYGLFWFNRRYELAHRWLHTQEIGVIPAGLELDHVKAWGCTHTNCVNVWEHIEAVTHKENLGRATWVRNGPLKGSRHANKRVPPTHCKHGHAFDEANTYWYRGHRSCRKCNAIREHARQLLLKSRYV